MINKGFKIGTLVYYVTDSGEKIWGKVVGIPEYKKGKVLTFTSMNDHIEMLKTKKKKDKPVLIRFHQKSSTKYGHYGWCSAFNIKKATTAEEILYGNT